MFSRVELLLLTLVAFGCSGGARNAPVGVMQPATRQVAAPAAPPATEAPSKCTRRHAVTTKDGRVMIVYTEDTGSCEPPRALAVTRVAVE